MEILYTLPIVGLLLGTAILLGCLNSSSLNTIHIQNYIKVKDGAIFYQTFGKGEPIIVLHGGPGLDQGYLLPQMLELAKDYKVTFYDQRGSGKSLDTKVNSKMINIEQFVEDLETLRTTLGCQKITLIGHSWGGLLAMHYAIAYSKHLNSLILINSGPTTSTGWRNIQEVAKISITESTQTSLEKLYNSQKFKQRDPKVVEEIYRLLFLGYFAKKADAQKLSLNFTPESAKGCFKENSVFDIFSKNYLTKFYNINGELKKMTVPTLVIHGESDPIPLWISKEIQSSIPNAKLIVIKECGHFPYIEKPKKLFGEIRKFLGGVKSHLRSTL